MLSKQIDRAATVAWCPSATCSSLIASGTVEGIIDDDFHSNSHLEICDTNLAIPGMDIPVKGSAAAHCCFKKIAWGVRGIQSNQYPAGLIAGGMIDGTICLWNADAVMRNQENAQIARTEPMNGPVLSLEFHPLQPNLFATGSQDSQIILWNLKTPERPLGEYPGEISKGHYDVPALAWNKKVLHILATANSRGEISIWDLRQKKVVITFRDSSHSNSPATSVMWNPTQARQLVVTYYGGHGEIWDLRHAMSPKYVLEGAHEKSILSASWNCLDPDVFLTSGEDSKCVIWDSRGNILNSFTTDDGPNFDVAWSPHSGPLIAGSSFNGKISVRAVQNTGDHVPSWASRPSGVCFGFGGKLVDFSAVAQHNQSSDKKAPKQPPTPAQLQFNNWTKNSTISLRQLSPDEELIRKTAQFSQIAENVDCRAFCDDKVRTTREEKERQTWSFIKILFEQNYKDGFIRHLGYEPPKPAVEDVAPDQDLPVLEANKSIKDDRRPSLDSEGSDEFFAKISTPGACTPAESDNESEDLPALERKEDLMFLEETDADAKIRNRLVVGDFEKAVDLSFDAGKYADALVIASCKPGLWQKTRVRFFNQHKLKFMKDVMKSVVVGEIELVVETSDLKDWRQTLAIILSYTHDERTDHLCNQLGDRLMLINDHDAALACFICACNVEKMITALMARDKHERHADPLVALHNAIEKAYVFSHATGSVGSPPDGLARKYSEYAQLMASQGQLDEALRFLDITSQGRPGPHFQVMMDRLFHSNPRAAEIVRQPPCPFNVINVPNTVQYDQQQTGTYQPQPGEGAPGHRRPQRLRPQRPGHMRPKTPNIQSTTRPFNQPARPQSAGPGSIPGGRPGGRPGQPLPGTRPGGRPSEQHNQGGPQEGQTTGRTLPHRQSKHPAYNRHGHQKRTGTTTNGFFGQNPVKKVQGLQGGSRPLAGGPGGAPLPGGPGGPGAYGSAPSGPGGQPGPYGQQRRQSNPNPYPQNPNAGLPPPQTTSSRQDQPMPLPRPMPGGPGAGHRPLPGGPSRQRPPGQPLGGSQSLPQPLPSQKLNRPLPGQAERRPMPGLGNNPQPGNPPSSMGGPGGLSGRRMPEPRQGQAMSPPSGLRPGPTVSKTAPSQSHPLPRPYPNRPSPQNPPQTQNRPSPMPSGPMPSGPMPSGPMPSGPLPTRPSPMPSGPMPSGPMPSGPMPSGPISSTMPSNPQSQLRNPLPQRNLQNNPPPKQQTNPPTGGPGQGPGRSDLGGGGGSTGGRSALPSRRPMPGGPGGGRTSAPRPQGWHSRPTRSGGLASRSAAAAQPPDISSLTPAHQAIMQAFLGGIERLNGANLAKNEQKRVQDCTKRLGDLAAKFGQNEISPDIEGKLNQVVNALSSGDYQTATNCNVEIITAVWSENRMWLTGVKNLINLMKKHKV